MVNTFRNYFSSLVYLLRESVKIGLLSFALCLYGFPGDYLMCREEVTSGVDVGKTRKRMKRNSLALL